MGVGAAIFAGIGVLNTVAAGDGDPNRVSAAIVGAVSFLGASTIFRDTSDQKGAARGLNTASGVWVTAAVGTGVGFGYFAVSGMATLLVVIAQHGVLFLLNPKFWRALWERLQQDVSYNNEDERKEEEDRERPYEKIGR